MFAAIARTHNFPSKRRRFKHEAIDVASDAEFHRRVNYPARITTNSPPVTTAPSSIRRTTTNDRCRVSHSVLICAARRRARLSPCLQRARPRVTPRPEDRRHDRLMMAVTLEHRLPTCLRPGLGKACSMPTS